VPDEGRFGGAARSLSSFAEFEFRRITAGDSFRAAHAIFLNVKQGCPPEP
jgi:hypothetical protein